MDHSKFIALIQKEDFICSFKSSANYYIQQQSLNHKYMMKHQILANQKMSIYRLYNNIQLLTIEALDMM